MLISIPPVVFFCLHLLGDNSGKVCPLRALKLEVRDGYFIRDNENQLTIAKRCLCIAKSML